MTVQSLRIVFIYTSSQSVSLKFPWHHSDWLVWILLFHFPKNKYDDDESGNIEVTVANLTADKSTYFDNIFYINTIYLNAAIHVVQYALCNTHTYTENISVYPCTRAL